MRIRTIDEYQVPLLVNGHRLKLYMKPLTKVEFTKSPEEINLTLIQGGMTLKRPQAGLRHSNEQYSVFFFRLLQFQCNCYAYSPQIFYPYKIYQAYTFLMQLLPISFNVILKYFVNSKHMFILNINLIHIYQTSEIHTNITPNLSKKLHFLFFYITILIKISYHFFNFIKTKKIIINIQHSTFWNFLYDQKNTLIH